MDQLLAPTSHNYFSNANSLFGSIVDSFNNYTKKKELIKKEKETYNDLNEKKSFFLVSVMAFAFLLIPRVAIFLLCLIPVGVLFLNKKIKKIATSELMNNKSLKESFDEVFGNKDNQMELLFHLKKLLEQLEAHSPNSFHTQNIRKHFKNIQDYFAGENTSLVLEEIIPEIFYAYKELRKEYRKLDFQKDFNKYYDSHNQEDIRHEREKEYGSLELY